MLKAESEKVMVSGAQVGRGLIGHGTVKMNSPSRKHVVSTESELGPRDSCGRPEINLGVVFAIGVRGVEIPVRVMSARDFKRC